LAAAAFWTGRTEEAIQAGRKAVLINPFGPDDYVSLIRYLIRAGRFPEILTLYNEARARKVEHPQLHWGSGLAHWGHGQC